MERQVGRHKIKNQLKQSTSINLFCLSQSHLSVSRNSDVCLIILRLRRRRLEKKWGFSVIRRDGGHKTLSISYNNNLGPGWSLALLYCTRRDRILRSRLSYDIRRHTKIIIFDNMLLLPCHQSRPHSVTATALSWGGPRRPPHGWAFGGNARWACYSPRPLVSLSLTFVNSPTVNNNKDIFR